MKELQMKPDYSSVKRLSITQSKAKLFEYKIPENEHIRITDHPSELFPLAIGLIGDSTDAILNIESSDDTLESLSSIGFSAKFFDSYVNAKFDSDLSPELLLIGSAAYYLDNLQGNSKVLIDKINPDSFDDNSIQKGVYYLLSNYRDPELFHDQGGWSRLNKLLAIVWGNYLKNGNSYNHVLDAAKNIKYWASKSGEPSDLFFGDLLLAIIIRKHQNSCWYALPLYSGLSADVWRSSLSKSGFINELWPAQHLLGQKGVFKGASAVVQMPTSAGKTKSSELIIRSAFLSRRTNVVLIVAPFKALCHEIKDDLQAAFQGENVLVSEISDVMQNDFVLGEILSAASNKIIVLTPEKLLYLLRQDQALATQVGLVVFDEGHQFDNGSRGITYELLLTSLKSLLASSTQKVLISAVISNAPAISEWLNGSQSSVIQGININPTYKTIGFTSWLYPNGMIRFVDEQNIDIDDYFVPGVLTSKSLKTKKGENARAFPEKNNGNSIALDLGLRVNDNGSVAIFCGRKDSVSTVASIALEIHSRGHQANYPVHHSNLNEVTKLKNLITLNLGENSVAARAADIGIFLHHSNTPQGLRMCIEHAMRESHIRFIICTSTLAQGVNLPIKYLILTSLLQAGEPLKVREFHNLIGRAGRAGKHTEGTIIFADNSLNDQRATYRYKWAQVKSLLDPSKSEACTSMLLSLLDPIYNEKGNLIYPISIIDFTTKYLGDMNYPNALSEQISASFIDKGFTQESNLRQLVEKTHSINAVQGFLMAHFDDHENADINHSINLGRQTLAYYLANDDQKKMIDHLFQIIATYIQSNLTTKEVRKYCSQTLFGLHQIRQVVGWTSVNINSLLEAKDDHDLLKALWPLLSEHITNKSFQKASDIEKLYPITLEWIEGVSYGTLLLSMQTAGIQLKWGTKFRNYNIDQVVEIFEGGFSFDGSLILGAAITYIDAVDFNGVDPDHKSHLVKRLKKLQKRLKYGLPSEESISLFELGFCDRRVAQTIYWSIGSFIGTIETAKFIVNEHYDAVKSILEPFPNYFLCLLEGLKLSKQTAV